MFVASFAFCVITFEPIEVQTCSAPQNDRLNLVFVVIENMTRNDRKDSRLITLSFALHSVFDCSILLSLWLNSANILPSHILGCLG